MPWEPFFDYQRGLHGHITFLAGETSQTITIPTLRDSETETSETMQLLLFNTDPDLSPLGVLLDGIPEDGTLTATGTITDGSTVAATVSVADATAAEGDDLDFIVSIDNALADDLVIRWGVVQGTALPGDDYHRLQFGSVTIEAGQTQATISVTTIDDDAGELEETMQLHLLDTNPDLPDDVVFEGQPESGILAATGTITDDDGDVVWVSIAEATAAEGADLDFVVSITAALSDDLIIRWGVVQGTALPGEDYHRAQHGRVTIEAGQTQTTISVTTIDDNAVENEENMSAVIASTNPDLPAGVYLQGNPPSGELSATGTITDND